MKHRWVLPHDLASVGQARALARQFLGGDAPVPDRDTVMLVVSELVTNAVAHGHGAEPIALELEAEDTVVRIGVTDGDPAPPRHLPHALDSERGRGLDIVDSLCERWGWAAAGDGSKRVWCQLRRGP